MSLKENKRIHIRLYFIFVYLLVALAAVVFCQKKENVTYDVIQMNRIVMEVQNSWGEVQQGDYSKFTYSFAVLDTSEALLYQSDADSTVTLAEAMKLGDQIFTIESDGRIAGTVIITTHTERIRQQEIVTRNRTLVTAGILLMGLFLLLLYDGYLKHHILLPLRRMEKFAHEIAQGNLEAPLSEQGSPEFSPLVQSFELMRDELKTAKQREYEANRSKKELVATLSHDIKTPVTSIKLAVEVLMVKVQEESVRERLEAIYGKTEQIDHLVTDLFHTTMEDLEELVVTPVETYSSELVRLIHEADCNGCVKELQIPDCMISMDSVRMGQVLANIIYNSYKYANTDITIRGMVKDKYLEIYIQDYGTGVEEEELPLIFNRFYRGKNAESQTGSGLGLFICKKLLVKMGGEIYCYNNEQGFQTILRLPLI